MTTHVYRGCGYEHCDRNKLPNARVSRRRNIADGRPGGIKMAPNIKAATPTIYALFRDYRYMDANNAIHTKSINFKPHGKHA